MSKEMLDKVNAILDKEIDPIFFELTKRIDKRISDSKYVPWLLAYKMDAESAKVVLALPDENWTSEMGEFGCSDEFCKKVGKERAYIEKELEERFFSGEVFLTDQGAIVTPSCGMWIDSQNSKRWFERNGDAYYKILGFYVESEVVGVDARLAAKMEKEGQMGQCRIIPRYDSVKDFDGLLPAENFKQILQSRDLIAQNQCACRIRYPELGLDPFVCLSFNNIAKLTIKMEIGRKTGWEEAFEYVQKQGKIQPHCHINKHSDDLNKIGDVFCSCSADACVLLKTPVTIGTEFKPWKYYGKSRFRAEIDPLKCVNCNLCKDTRCMFGAIDVRYNKDAKIEKNFVVSDMCMGCGCCVETCPQKAIKMNCVQPPEYLLGKVLETNDDLSNADNIRPGAKLEDIVKKSKE